MNELDDLKQRVLALEIKFELLERQLTNLQTALENIVTSQKEKST